MKAIIIDDDFESIKTLCIMLEKFCPHVSIIATCSETVSAETVLAEVKPDLVFLDIEMPGKDGITFLKDQNSPEFEVIFVTGHDEFLLQALRLAAVDYLLKPVDPYELIYAVEQAKSRFSTKTISKRLEVLTENLINKENIKNGKICLSDADGYYIVRFKDVLYLEADNTYTLFFLMDGRQMLISKPLIEYERLLPEEEFFRIHKSYLVNMSHVTGFKKTEGGCVVLSSGRELEVSRRKKDELLERIKNLFLF
ncbi:MAG TPA: LytTR family DNA-binding domain-containing protein [Saprospiraceae bacterium]|nr:LytTR family DNA-binding domain-containing protein [Saprospiraceae bacterium]HPN70278.1 LytTR family DNA-binding domain-containing protein [Saprospiraceae bacterium]